MHYTYNPHNITENGRDRMRFELGDTQVEGGAATCVLSDEEYDAVLSDNRSWQQLKLRLLEAICMKLSYQVDTKVDVLSYSFSSRADMWRSMYDELKKRVSTGNPGFCGAAHGEPYFYSGMQENSRTK